MQKNIFILVFVACVTCTNTWGMFPREQDSITLLQRWETTRSSYEHWSQEMKNFLAKSDHFWQETYVPKEFNREAIAKKAKTINILHSLTLALCETIKTQLKCATVSKHCMTDALNKLNEKITILEQSIAASREAINKHECSVREILQKSKNNPMIKWQTLQPNMKNIIERHQRLLSGKLTENDLNLYPLEYSRPDIKQRAPHQYEILCFQCLKQNLRGFMYYIEQGENNNTQSLSISEIEKKLHEFYDEFFRLDEALRNYRLNSCELNDFTFDIGVDTNAQPPAVARIMYTKIPVLSEAPISRWQAMRNIFWPSTPKLAVVPKQLEKAITTTEVMDRCEKSFNNNNVNFINQAAAARGWRLGFVSAVGIWAGARQALSNARFFHANTLAIPVALAGLLISKPIFSFMNSQLLAWQTNNDNKNTALLLRYNQYIKSTIKPHKKHMPMFDLY